MPKLPPSGYIPAAQHAIGFAKRMKLYRQQVEDEKRKREENVTQFKPKIKAKP